MNSRYFPLKLLKKIALNNSTEAGLLRARLTHSGHIPSPHELAQDYEEVEIPVPWGHIAGKWYGPKHIRPIVGLHGWQDNAGTFDTLAPLLPQNVAFLSVDLPGHGFSSRIPDGMCYDSFNQLFVIHLLMKEYNWKKISIIGHSMSSLVAFIFSSLFPEKVEMLIGLDAPKIPITTNENIIKDLANRVNNFMVADKRNREKSEPPSYIYDDLIERLYEGSFHSIEKDKCKYILARNITKSMKYPDQYYFSRDSRIKSFNIVPDINLDMTKKIIAPYLFIKATKSSVSEVKEYFDEAVEDMKQNPKFEFHTVLAAHHFHLNEPEKISKIINSFIERNHTAKEDNVKTKSKL